MIDKNELFIDQNLPNPLSKNEIYELFKKYKNGDNKARDTIIIHNIKLVLHRVMKRFNNTSYENCELVEIGLIGLIKAVDSFNIDRYASFSSYAGVCIDNEILMFMRTDKERCDNISLDENMNSDTTDRYTTLKDVIPDTSVNLELEYENKEIINLLKDLTQKLNDRDKDIVILYFIENYTQQQIADKYNISRSYISRVILKILEKLKFELNDRGINGEYCHYLKK